MFGQRSDEIQPFVAFELAQIPQKLRRRRVAGGIGHSHFAGPFGTRKLIEGFRGIARLDHIRVIQNADWQHPPGVIMPSFSLNWAGNFSDDGGMNFWNSPSSRMIS